ncbi:LOW QUALITY PROTEIN: actin-like protein 8 [Dromiciops gliroides]|uniref:LOW QUALITY PROTEIN: actin-like protein 8 n=1 Tax=Dromiciops gliroides TaxID=33562 RepID=UPI001CC80766|nr:LOW QUALITY PROTEIN: actin-like protein 8 [Dromiciops gliroides]
MCVRESVHEHAIGSTFIPLMELESSPVIIDVGSAWCKAGYSGNNHPSVAIPTVVGYQSHDEDLGEGPSNIRKVVGLENKHVLRELPITDFPVHRGKVLNWEAMEAIWNYAFDVLRVNTKNHPVLVTELPWKDRNNRQKILEVMMETFNVPSLCFGNEAELAMFGSGLLNGTVVDCGAGLTRIAPVFGGKVMMETFNVPSLHIGNQAELALFGSGLLTGMVLECGASLTQITPILRGQRISKRTAVFPGHTHGICFYRHPPLPIGSTFIFLMEEVSMVIDIGSDCCRAGPGGKNQPIVAVPEVIGYQPYPEDPGPSNPPKRKIVGLINLPLLRTLAVEFPVQRGQITNWNAMETILKYSYDLLGFKTGDHPVLVTGFQANPVIQRKKLLEVMMESFNVPSLYIGNQAELCLFGSGFLTGLILHSGSGVTSITPVCNGRIKYLTNKMFEMAGLDISLLIYKTLFNANMNMSSLSQRYDMDALKEKFCYVSRHPNQKGPAVNWVSSAPEVTVLPDGRVITLPKELFTYPDIFFTTTQHDLPHLDLSTEIIETIKTCDSEEQATLFSHVVLSGGNTLFSGFPERLFCELNTTRPHWSPAEVVSRPNRMYLPWVGGSILSCLSTFNSQCLTNKEYQEVGQ